MGSSTDRAGYPLARVLAGDDASPLWDLPPAFLDRVSADDTAAAAAGIEKLAAAVEGVRRVRGLLAIETPDGLHAADRAAIRGTWFRMLDALLAVDRHKQRYEGWWGVDYFDHPELHARTFGIAFACLCAQVTAGHALVQAVGGFPLAQSLFDEAMPELGLPRGTFSALRSKLARSRDHSYVLVGREWYEEWIAEHLGRDAVGRALGALVARELAGASDALGLEGAAATLLNKLELLKSAAFEAWIPLQKEVATWLGDTRMISEGARLVRDEQIAALASLLRPGDILLERRNWYLSNVGLPGFWPHAALFVGSRDELARALGADAGVRAELGDLDAFFAARSAAGLAALGTPDEHGKPRRVIEAVGEGVIATSVEHSAAADYVAVLRPRLPPVEVARAVGRALSFFGRPYDFAFDFATDDAVVCSELVVKAYEPERDAAPGLRFAWDTVVGKRVVTPTSIARTFARERGTDARQLDFVRFLDGIEASERAVVADEGRFAASAERPKWDLLQP